MALAASFGEIDKKAHLKAIHAPSATILAPTAVISASIAAEFFHRLNCDHLSADHDDLSLDRHSLSAAKALTASIEILAVIA